MKIFFTSLASTAALLSVFIVTPMQNVQASGLLSAGLRDACAITASGIQCWGRESDDPHAFSSNIPVLIKGTSHATSVVTGGPGVTCFLSPSTPETGIKKIGDDLFCRGSNAYGLARGNGSYNGYIDTPTFIDIWDIVYQRDEKGNVMKKNGRPVIMEKIGAEEVAIGGSHILVRLANSAVKTWGEGWGSPKPFGALGRETHFAKKNAFKPTLTAGFQHAISISAGTKFSCAVLTGGGVRCTGDNSYGALGNGSKNAKSELPVDVQGIKDAVSVSAGGQFACALLSNGSVMCWGSNSVGESGNGADYAKHLSPVAVTGLRDKVTALSAGSNHVCALLADQTVQCWGKDSNGQLGDGVDLTKQKNKTTNKPVDVVGLTSISRLSLGGEFSCAQKKDGQILCWGDDTFGQLGDGKGLKIDPANKKKIPMYLRMVQTVPSTVQF